MQFKKLFLLFIASVVVIGLLAVSIWYRWNTDQELAQQRIPELTPTAEFNHGSPQIGDIAISPVNSDIIASVGPITSDTFTSNGEDSVIKAWDPRDNKGSIIKIWNRNNTNTPVLTLTDHRGKYGKYYIAFSATGERLISRNASTLVFWMQLQVLKLMFLISPLAQRLFHPTDTSSRLPLTTSNSGIPAT